MSDQSISQMASVAPGVATLKRSLQMKHFASADDRTKVAFLNTKEETAKRIEAGEAEVFTLAVGQVLGQIFKVDEKVGQLPDGSEKTSLLAIGDFEALSYKTGEIFSASSAYLPAYFLETVRAILAHPSNPGVVDFAVEIVLVPTFKSIPVAYEVKNLITRRPGNPINRLKAELAAANRLRLPPPPPETAEVLKGEVVAVERLPAPDDEAADLAAGARDDSAAAEGEPDVDDGHTPAPAVEGGKGRAKAHAPA